MILIQRTNPYTKKLQTHQKINTPILQISEIKNTPRKFHPEFFVGILAENAIISPSILCQQRPIYQSEHEPYISSNVRIIYEIIYNRVLTYIEIVLYLGIWWRGVVIAYSVVSNDILEITIVFDNVIEIVWLNSVEYLKVHHEFCGFHLLRFSGVGYYIPFVFFYYLICFFFTIFFFRTDCKYQA